MNDSTMQMRGADWHDGTLRITWRKGVGEYDGVPEKVFQSLCRVPFATSYYTKAIKVKYPYRKVEDDEHTEAGTAISS